MVGEIEADLECLVRAGNRRGCQTSRGYIKGGVPPMINRRGECKAYLADNLRPHVHSLIRIFPLLIGQARPNFFGVACSHNITYYSTLLQFADRCKCFPDLYTRQENPDSSGRVVKNERRPGSCKAVIIQAVKQEPNNPRAL